MIKILYIDWEKGYRKSHPNASDEEVNEAFKKAWGK